MPTNVLPGLVLAFSGMLLLSQPSNANRPLPSGTVVRSIFLDTSGNLPGPDPGPPTDVVVFTGGREFSTILDGCREGEPMHVLNAVIVDADGSRSSRNITVFVGVTALPDELGSVTPGTRLTAFSPLGTCSSGGILYQEYTATVQ